MIDTTVVAMTHTMPFGPPMVAVEPTGLIGSTRTVRVALTGVILASVLVVYRAIHSYGAPAERYFTSHTVKALQGMVGMVVLLAGGTLLIGIWNQGSVVDTSRLDGTTVSTLAVTVGLLIAAYLLTRLTKQIIQAVFEGDRLSVHQREIAHHLIQVGIYGVATLVVLSMWNVPLGRLLIGAGAATIVFGLAARQTLGALLAGFVLLFARPFEIGDWVIIDDKEGVVEDINIVKTQLQTFDDEHVMIPNDKITGADIVNRSREGQLRVSMELRVDYDTDLMRAVEAAQEALEAVDIEAICEEPAPEVVVKRFEPSAVIMELRVWIGEPSAGRKWAARTAISDAVTRRFDEEGIEIPYPKREFTTADPDRSEDAITTEVVSARDGRLVVTDADAESDLSSEQAAALATLLEDHGSGGEPVETETADSTADPSSRPEADATPEKGRSPASESEPEDSPTSSGG